jgi:hypothetical protein
LFDEQLKLAKAISAIAQPLNKLLFVIKIFFVKDVLFFWIGKDY